LCHSIEVLSSTIYIGCQHRAGWEARS
jgi:hypothetical protein